MDRRERMLVVTDDPRVVTKAARIAEAMDCECTVVGVADLVVGRIEGGPFDLVVTQQAEARRSDVDLGWCLRSLDAYGVALSFGADRAPESIDPRDFEYGGMIGVSLLDSDEVLVTVARKALDARALRRVRSDRRGASPGAMLGAFVANSAAMRATIALAREVAITDRHVLITGASGTGKDRLARAIHDGSPRRTRAFSVVNFGALPPPLLDPELFGQVVSGCWSGKPNGRLRPGALLRGKDGTLVLDDLTSMPADRQLAFADAISQGFVSLPGWKKRVPVVAQRYLLLLDRDVDAEVAAGRFAARLLAALDPVRVDILPLANRVDDIRDLVLELSEATAHRLFGVAGATIEPEAMDRLVAAEWPGNVRQLQHAIESVMARAGRPALRLDAIEEVLAGYRSRHHGAPSA